MLEECNLIFFFLFFRVSKLKRLSVSLKRLLSNFGIVKDNKMITSEVGLNAFCVMGWHGRC